MPARRPPPPRVARRPTQASLISRLRAICLALPEANEKIAHGEPTWRAGKGRVFAILDDHHHGAAHLSVWLPQPLGRQEAMIDADPDLFFRPPYVGPSGWVGVVLDRDPDWGMVASLVEDAFRYVARPKLIAQLDAPVPAPPAPRRKTRAR
jgi:hypothetical protein